MSAKIIPDHLAYLYGKETAKSVWKQLKQRLERFRHRNSRLLEKTTLRFKELTEQDVILITYADQIRELDKPPLLALAGFLKKNLKGVVNTIHLLPFFPHSSDDGFSVINYRQVNPEMGNWENVASIGQNFRLMFDGVINHVSQQNEWFQAFLQNQEPYRDFFITVGPDIDLSQVVRPRDLPLLTSFNTTKGIQDVWTTFSSDQVDLNYRNPDVLLEIIDVLLFYIEKGAGIIRLDAFAYLWKEMGTSCIHLPQTHRVLKLFRAVMELAAPGVFIITETNAPQKENISYFGEPLNGSDNYDEAHMVYRFTLAPLVLHAFVAGSSRLLSRWASSVKAPSPSTTFFNFIASHDGIGLIPARGYLDESEIKRLVDRTLSHNGKLSYTSNPDGSRSVYELNITLFDALNNPEQPDPELDIPRFLASQVILLSLAGVPGIYIHSLFGSRNYDYGRKEGSVSRSINREKLSRWTLEAELADRNSNKSIIFSHYRHLLHQRKNQPAFRPDSEQRVLFLDDALFAIVRIAQDGNTVICIVNICASKIAIDLLLREWALPEKENWRDLIAETDYRVRGGNLALVISPYQALWLHNSS